MQSKDAASDLLTARICAMILLPGITFVLGMLPLWLSKLLKWDKATIKGLQGDRAQFILSQLLCFAGGVLLSTVFMHLLPDLEDLCDEQLALGHLPDLGPAVPWAELLLCSGLFLVYFIEEAAHAFVHWQSKTQHPKQLQHQAATPCIEEIQQNITGIPINVEKEKDITIFKDDGPEKNNEHNHNGHGHGHSHEGHGGGGHSHIPIPGGDTLIANLRNILTIIALSFHCIFEGIAVGMQDSASEVWYLFGAISTHKFVIAFCVGVELLVSSTRILFVYIYIFIFGFVSLLGIVIGMAIAGTGVDPDADPSSVIVIMQGIAAGTIVYVTFFEILQREKNTKNNGFVQLLSIITGFVAMVGLMSIVPPEE